MTSDSGNLSIDFIVGFTIFLIAFIWVVSMIPGLLVNLQGYTIDYDAVAYRTGVILAEDPGEPSLPSSIIPWENLISRDGVVRFGLAVSKDTPNILSRKKVDRFFCLTVFSYPVDYQNRTIFGDYPYQFNISLIERGSIHPPQYVGDNMPAAGSSGYIRRLVRIKEPALAVINASSYDAITVGYNKTAHPDYLNGDNESVHEFSILINKSELLKDTIRDPTYQINPGLEQTIINITHLNQTIYPDRSICYTISLTNITIKNEVTGVTGFLEPPLPPYTATIDGDKEYNSSSSPLPQPSTIKENITLILEPPTYWAVVEKSYVNLKFKLENTSGRPLYCEEFNGTRFLNNTFTFPFGYNYSSANVIQPHLQDAVLQIKVSSGARNVTEIVVAQLEAAFTYNAPGLTVQFIDQSKGSPVDWYWDFGDGNTATTNNPSHTYAGQGTYSVTLTIKDASGTSKSVTKSVDLSAPVAAFSGTPLAGNTPLDVQFTDASTGGAPTSWRWAYRNATVGWTQFASTQNPAFTFATGVYDINLTAANAFGSDDEIKPAYITVSPPLPPTFTSITPASGPIAGGTPVTIVGTNFVDGGSFGVTIGGAAATSVVRVDATHITALTPAHTAGAVDVVITNNDGQTATGTSAYTYGTPPVAQFSGTPVTGNSPLAVTFTDASTGTITAYAWDFNNDGTVDSTLQNPTYTYTTAGTYTVNLTVSGPGGSDFEAKSGYITVFTVVTFTTVGPSSWSAPAGVTSVQYVVVGGGGGGGGLGGGGGAGGFRTASGYPVIPLTSYTVTVGAGGAGGTSGHAANGGNSVFASITSTGGGGGGTSSGTAAIRNGANGGSGGGAARGAGSIGLGNNPFVTPSQGNNGGLGRSLTSPTRYYGGGGGGASAVGGAASGTTAGSGGAGTASSISGTSVIYAGGGGGGATSGTAGSGGSGVGGNGAVGNAAGSNGAANRGGGGGGSGSTAYSGGSGGSGIVIIRYTIP